jgi:hypothetical protein
MPDNQLMKFLTLLIMLVSLATALVDLKTASLSPPSPDGCGWPSTTMKSSRDAMTHV